MDPFITCGKLSFVMLTFCLSSQPADSQGNSPDAFYNTRSHTDSFTLASHRGEMRIQNEEPSLDYSEPRRRHRHSHFHHHRRHDDLEGSWLALLPTIRVRGQVHGHSKMSKIMYDKKLRTTLTFDIRYAGEHFQDFDVTLKVTRSLHHTYIDSFSIRRKGNSWTTLKNPFRGESTSLMGIRPQNMSLEFGLSHLTRGPNLITLFNHHLIITKEDCAGTFSRLKAFQNGENDGDRHFNFEKWRRRRNRKMRNYQ